jgi:hypothetical protein
VMNTMPPGKNKSHATNTNGICSRLLSGTVPPSP